MYIYMYTYVYIYVFIRICMCLYVFYVFIYYIYMLYLHVYIIRYAYSPGCLEGVWAFPGILPTDWWELGRQVQRTLNSCGAFVDTPI